MTPGVFLFPVSGPPRDIGVPVLRALTAPPSWLADPAATARMVAGKKDDPPGRAAWHDVAFLARACQTIAATRSPAHGPLARVGLDLCDDLTELFGTVPGGPPNVPMGDPNELLAAAPCFDAFAFAAVDLADTLDGYTDPGTVACLVDDARAALIAYLLTIRLNARRGTGSRRPHPGSLPTTAAPALRLIRGGAAQ